MSSNNKNRNTRKRNNRAATTGGGSAAAMPAVVEMGPVSNNREILPTTISALNSRLPAVVEVREPGYDIIEAIARLPI